MEIEGATSARTDGRRWSASGVSIDSEKFPKDIFIAFRGSRVDGHCYVADAFEKGAARCYSREEDRWVVKKAQY